MNTKAVTGRREVHYDTFDDALADAERLAAGDVRTLGNWSYGQILKHLAMAVGQIETRCQPLRSIPLPSAQGSQKAARAKPWPKVFLPKIPETFITARRPPQRPEQRAAGDVWP